MHHWKINKMKLHLLIRKRVIGLWLFLSLSLPIRVAAQPQGGFDPRRFDAEMEQFIVTEAGLTPTEASRFFPLFHEMQRKQRACFDQMRVYRHVDPNDDKAAAEAIRKQDEIDLNIKKIQQQYHNKFIRVLPPGKVLRVIKAEAKFHRQAFKRMAKRPR